MMLSDDDKFGPYRKPKRVLVTPFLIVSTLLVVFALYLAYLEVFTVPSPHTLGLITGAFALIFAGVLAGTDRLLSRRISVWNLWLLEVFVLFLVYSLFLI